MPEDAAGHAATVDVTRALADQIDAHVAVTARLLAAVGQPFTRLVAACRAALAGSGKVMFFGNGGSAADAQHLATELVVRYRVDRRALAAIALTTDSSLVTAAANDLGYDQVFARQILALGRPGDVAIGISTSGNSPNVLKALEAAGRIGVVPAGLAGRDGGRMVGLADPLLVVPADDTARIQEMHILLGHVLCDLLEQDAAACGADTSAAR